MDAAINTPSLFLVKHSLAIRIWHWVTFVLFTSTIVTVLLANTMFDTKSNIEMVQNQVKEKGGNITSVQARSVSHEYNDKLWNTHKIIGYFLCFSLLSRIIIEFATSKEEKISSRIKYATNLSKSVNDNTNSKHYLTVKYTYLIFYFLFLLMAATGLVLAYEDVEFLKPIQSSVRSIHEFGQYCIYGFIVIHLVGVIRSDVTENPGIISKMINNGKSTVG